MNNEDEKGISLNILKHLEDLSNQINYLMASRAKAVFRRYPVTFGLLILFGVTSLHEGLKGLMSYFGILEMNPLYLCVVGLVILTFTGTLYKKLEK